MFDYFTSDLRLRLNENITNKAFKPAEGLLHW